MNLNLNLLLLCIIDSQRNFLNLRVVVDIGTCININLDHPPR